MLAFTDIIIMITRTIRSTGMGIKRWMNKDSDKNKIEIILILFCNLVKGSGLVVPWMVLVSRGLIIVGGKQCIQTNVYL